MKMIKRVMLLALIQPMAAFAGNDFPTVDRVNYVLDCMDRHGEQSITNLLGCSCTIDAIASKMKYEKYSDAKTYEEYKDTPGDKGDAFRTNERAKTLYNKMGELEAEAEKHCFVKQIVPKAKPEAAAAKPAEAAKPEAPAEGNKGAPAPSK